MKTIPLRVAGKESRIDDEDYERVSKHNWSYWKGSCTSKINGRTVHLHRFILNLTAFDKVEVDHIDRDVTNNQKSNLRIVTHSQNSINKFSVSKYGYRGITYCNKVKAFYARIKINGKRISLGKYATAKEAAIAYNEGALKYHGEFAQLNVIV